MTLSRRAPSCRSRRGGNGGVARGEKEEDDKFLTSDQAVETARLLAELGVPPRRISSLGGYNTKSEMLAIADFAVEHPGESIGIISSAWHLARVTRLARSCGVEFTAFAADHETGVDELYYFPIPITGGFRRFERAIKEFISIGIGR